MKKSLVSIVGVDGAGKTIQSKYLVSRLREQDIKAIYWKSPAFDWVRSSMRVSGDDKRNGDIHTDAVIFAHAHRMEQYLIRQMWEGDLAQDFRSEPGVKRMLGEQPLPADVLVGQRGVTDFYAFLITEGMRVKELDSILGVDCHWKGHRTKQGEFVSPDLIIYLQCNPEVAMRRIPKEDKWEEVPFLQKLENTYEELFANRPKILRSARLIRINAEQPIEAVQEELDEKILKNVIDYLS